MANPAKAIAKIQLHLNFIPSPFLISNGVLFRGRKQFGFTSSNRWSRRTRRYRRATGVFSGRDLNQQGTEERLQGRRRRILLNFMRPCAVNRLRCHNHAGGQNRRRSYGEASGPGPRFGRRRFRHDAARLGPSRNLNAGLLLLGHSHPLTIRLGLGSHTFAWLRVRKRTRRDRERSDPCQAKRNDEAQNSSHL
jgi:hypothetical protein